MKCPKWVNPQGGEVGPGFLGLGGKGQLLMGTGFFWGRGERSRIDSGGGHTTP